MNIETEAAPSRLKLRRARVVETARGLFEARGFHATGITQIVEVSGVTVQQMYRDFGSKEAIFAAVADEEMKRIFSGKGHLANTGCVKGGDLIDLVGDIFLQVSSPAKTRLLLEVVAESSRNAPIAEIFQCVDARFRSGLKEMFCPFAADENQVDSVVELTMVMVGGIASRWAANPSADLLRLSGIAAGYIVSLLMPGQPESVSVSDD